MGGYGWLGSRVVRLACWTQAQKGPGSNRSRDAVEYSNGSLCDRMSVRPFACPSVCLYHRAVSSDVQLVCC